jgi:hypothetical protein
MSENCAIPREGSRMAPRVCCSAGGDLRVEVFDVARTWLGTIIP